MGYAEFGIQLYGLVCGFQGGAGRGGWEGSHLEPGIGADFKARLTSLAPWTMSFGGFGETLYAAAIAYLEEHRHLVEGQALLAQQSPAAD